MPIYNRDRFSLDYEGFRMRMALFNGQDLGTALSNIISPRNIDGMNSMSDKIFKLIMELDTEVYQYELSIALTNYYFETVWCNWEPDIQEGKTKIAEERKPFQKSVKKSLFILLPIDRC
jgi:hypothetical protein